MDSDDFEIAAATVTAIGTHARRPPAVGKTLCPITSHGDAGEGVPP